MNQMKLSVVIPAYNEERNIEQTVKDLQGALKGEGIPHELIVVNDNSRDRTAEVIASLMAVFPEIRTVNREPPGGFGRAIRAGLELVSGEVVVIFMADSSDDPRDVVAYYRKLEEGYDCVFGSRFIKGGRVEHYPFVKLIVNRIVNKVIQWLFWVRPALLPNMPGASVLRGIKLSSRMSSATRKNMKSRALPVS